MTTKRGTSDAQKAKEGLALKAKWIAYRERNPDETQEAFCTRLGLNQGYLQQMFGGKSAIALEVLLDAAILMEFDPREIRPELDVLLAKFIRAVEGSNMDRLESKVRSLPKASQEAALKYLEFLAERPAE